MTRTDIRPPTTLGSDGRAIPETMTLLPDQPGEVVCRCLLARDDAMLELGVADDQQQASTVYLVAVEHRIHLSPDEARAAADHLLRAAEEAEARAG